MRISFLTQHPATLPKDSLQSFLMARIDEDQFDVARVAAAYATVSGVRALLAAFERQGLSRSFWLVGLDDAITQPGAIELLLSLDNAEVRVASYQDANFRFHPKLFAFARAAKSKKQLSLIGSANLTASAFFGNAEAVAILDSQSKDDRSLVDAAWASLWIQGHEPTAAELEAYKEFYKRASNIHKAYKKLIWKNKKKSKQLEVLSSDEAELDPSMASTCWIECGYITAMGRELEIKAEQGLFFGLNPSGEKPKQIKIRNSQSKLIEIRMKYQKNHMWRLQMNNSIPEVKTGLRPIQGDGKLGRSPYVAVFEKLGDRSEYVLHFLKLNSNKFKQLLAKTETSGTLGKTTARQYGWCNQ